MNVHVLNVSLLLGWLLVSLGAGLLNLAAGMITSGALLLVLAISVARVVGVYSAPVPAKESQRDEAEA